ncbi:hypothetical protein ACFOGJ_10020, partial [Marinibaculum pumilum]
MPAATLRSGLLTGTALVCLTLVPAAAMAQDSLVRTETGSNGSNGEHNEIESNVSSSAGTAGGDITETVSRSLSYDGDLPQSVILLTTVGGTGGNGDENVSASDGGNGGAVTLTVERDVTATGPLVNGLVATSTGGDSGGGAYASTTERSSVDGPAAGEGGAVTVTVGSGAQVKVSKQSSALVDLFETTLYGLQIASTGGNGGNGGGVSGGFFNGYPGTGGTGGKAGTAGLTLDGKVTASATGGIGLAVTSVGGDGGDGGSDGGNIVNDPGDGGA